MRGFTLIESLVYIVLFGIILSTAFVGSESLAESTDRTKTQARLQSEADFLSSKIALNPDQIKVTSAGIVVSKFYYLSSAYSSTYYFTLSTLTNQGQKITKDFSVLIPAFP